MDAPTITKIHDKVATLERRKAHLERRIADHGDSQSTTFDRAEVGALKAAIEALRFHGLGVDLLDVVSKAVSGIGDQGQEGNDLLSDLDEAAGKLFALRDAL